MPRILPFCNQSPANMRSLFPVTIALILLASCGQNNEEAERLRQEKALLQQQLEEKEKTLNQFIGTLNEIEENLQSIRQKEDAISLEAGKELEVNQELVGNINENIRKIGELMERNRRLMNSLHAELSQSNLQIKEFERMVRRLHYQLEDKETEILILRDDLGHLNLRVESLTAVVDTLQILSRQKDRVIDEKTLELNTAFFAMGSRRALRDQGIIKPEGGFLGIGRVHRLKPDFKPDFFTRIDMELTREIIIRGKNPEFITVHPAGSWRWQQDGETLQLQILQPDKFWSTSRYLVLETE